MTLDENGQTFRPKPIWALYIEELDATNIYIHSTKIA